MIDYILANPAIMVSLIIFVVCIIIGFVSNIYMVKAGKIGKIFEDTIKKEPENDETEEKTEE